jgi:hypothetical protein
MSRTTCRLRLMSRRIRRFSLHSESCRAMNPSVRQRSTNVGFKDRRRGAAKGHRSCWQPLLLISISLGASSISTLRDSSLAPPIRLSKPNICRYLSCYQFMVLVCRFADSITQLVRCASRLLWYPVWAPSNTRRQQDAELSVTAPSKPGAQDKSHHRQSGGCG